VSTPDKCQQCFNAEQDAELLAMSVTTLKARVEQLKKAQQQLVSKQPNEKPSSRFDGEYDTEYNQGFNGHGY
jgi:predicted RNA-binding protein with PIN domain